MIRVQAEDFDIGIELNKLTNGNSHIGGIVVLLVLFEIWLVIIK